MARWPAPGGSHAIHHLPYLTVKFNRLCAPPRPRDRVADRPAPDATLRAINPQTGKIVWEHKEQFPLWAGTLATAGGLLITGTSDGFVKAFDNKNGKELWKFQTGSGIVSVPVTWEMDGEQYVAIQSGYGGAVPLWGGDMAELTKQVSQGGSMWVFKLPKAQNVARK